MMNRRDFLSNAVKAGIISSTAIGAGREVLFGAEQQLPYDLVAAKGAGPEKMFDKAIASLGGMSQFVKKGQKVVLKPNIGWDASPERAANTNPGLVKRVVEHCFQAGASKVMVFDNTCNNWVKCYNNSGIKEAVEEAGGKMIPGHSEKYYQKVDIPGGKSLKSAKVHELYMDNDVLINMPVLKHHGGAGLTIAMKNLMGVVWDRRYWHDNDLHQCIADFPTFKKPDLNIVDAYRVLMKNGPRGVSVEDTEIKKYLLISRDIVSVDASAAKVFGRDPEGVDHIRIADEMNVGNMNLEKLNINRLVVS